MGEVIEFNKFRKKPKVDESYRLKMLARGKIEVYTCNNCGGDIEVIDGEFPKECPCCQIEIEEWNE